MGDGREVVVAAFVAARLAAAALPPVAFPPAIRAQRAAAARTWLAGLAMPSATRTSLARLIDATGRNDMRAVHAALRPAVDAVARVLSPPARRELEALAAQIADA